MQLIQDRSRNHYHVSRENTWDFEKEILADPRLRPQGAWARHLVNAIYYLLSRSGKGEERWAYILRLRPPIKSRTDLFCILLGLEVRKAMPLAFSSGLKSIYLLDAWPSLDRQLVEMVRTWHIDPVFVQSSQSVARLAKLAPESRFLWLPEAADPVSYDHRPYADRDIDVLEFGRKYDVYHERIAGPLQQAGRVHLYERRKGEVIFPTKESFRAGLARARLSICFPSSLTHPDWSGGVETLTGRYLQSMLSGCLVVGHAPQELTDLFGYNPVMEVDWHDPAGQILNILARYDKYIPLIERNYQQTCAGHTWHHRWQQVAGILFA